MPQPTLHPSASRERGGITIVVSLMLLVLLTISALGLSRNALRQAVIAGTVRQAAQVENLADAGVEWSVYWLGPDPFNTRAAPTGGALAVQAARNDRVISGAQGLPTAPVSTSDMTLYSDTNVTQRFDISVTYMGNITPAFQTPDPHKSPAQSGTTDLQLFVTRSNGYLAYTGSATFVHSREAWFTTPKQSYQ